MKPLLYFLHGWAYDADYWKSFLEAVEPSSYIVGDLGFFEEAPTSYPKADFIGIGHSMGFLKMLLDWPTSMKGLIGINAFPRFLQSADFSHGIPAVILERMKERLISDPQKLLQNFWAKGNIMGPNKRARTDCLSEALDFLLKADGRRDLRKIPQGSLMFISGKQDHILQVQEADFIPHEQYWVEGGGHHLPHSHAKECGRLIEAFINKYVR